MKRTSIYILVVFLCGSFAVGNAQKNKLFVRKNQSNMRSMVDPNLPQSYKSKAVTIGAEFLYWHYTNEFAGNYASVPLANGVSPGADPLPGSNADVDFHYRPGFRAYLGYNLNHDVGLNNTRQLQGWDMFWIYTWNRWNRNQGNLSAVNGTPNLIFYILTNTVAPFTINVGVENVRYQESYHFNHLDYEIGRNYFLASFVNLRPHWGLRGALYKQQIHMDISKAVAQDSPNNQVFELTSFHTDDVRAIGMKMGFDTNWYMDQNWSFIANANFAYLYARQHLSEKIVSENQTSLIRETRSKGTRTLHSLIPESELRLGLQWDSWNESFYYRTVFNVCWEFIYMYEGTAQIGDNNAIRRNSPSIQGLTMNLGFQF